MLCEPAIERDGQSQRRERHGTAAASRGVTRAWRRKSSSVVGVVVAVKVARRLISLYAMSEVAINSSQLSMKMFTFFLKNLVIEDSRTVAKYKMCVIADWWQNCFFSFDPVGAKCRVPHRTKVPFNGVTTAEEKWHQVAAYWDEVKGSRRQEEGTYLAWARETTLLTSHGRRRTFLAGEFHRA